LNTLKNTPAMKKILILCLCSISFLKAYCADPPVNDIPFSQLLLLQEFSSGSTFTDNSWNANSSFNDGIKYGYIAGPVVLALAIASEITKQNQIPSLPIGITATVVSLISVPIIAVNAQGLSPEWMKVKKAAWFAYGGGMFLSSILIGAGIAGATPPTPVIAVNGIVFASSIVLMTHCSKYSGSSTAARKPNMNIGIAPVPEGGICTLAFRF
jgi:hypothetical protein